MSFYEDSSMELKFVTFIVGATWCGLDNHQASLETRGSNHVCRPPKSTVLTVPNCHSHSEFDWYQKFNVFLVNESEAGLTNPLVCSNTKWYTKFSCLPCLFWTFLCSRLALCLMMSSWPFAWWCQVHLFILRLHIAWIC